MASFLEEKFTPHLLRKAAISFNPEQKSMMDLSPTDRKIVHVNVSDQLERLPLQAEVQHQLIQHSSVADASPSAKRSRMAFDEYDDLPENAVDNSELEPPEQYHLDLHHSHLAMVVGACDPTPCTL